MDFSRANNASDIQKSHLVDKAYQSIKQWIVQYMLKPGAQLSPGELAEALQMSQTPIRESLIRLELERFVQRSGSKGFVVRTLDIKEVEEIYELRIILEVPAVAQAVIHMNDEAIERLSENLRNVKALIDEGRKVETVLLENEFHSIIFRSAQNKLLGETAQKVLDRVTMIQNLDVLTSNRISQAYEQHEEIYRVISQRDPDAAVTIMKEHLDSAKLFIVSRLQSEEDIFSRLLTGLPTGMTQPIS